MVWPGGGETGSNKLSSALTMQRPCNVHAAYGEPEKAASHFLVYFLFVIQHGALAHAKRSRFERSLVQYSHTPYFLQSTNGQLISTCTVHCDALKWKKSKI